MMHGSFLFYRSNGEERGAYAPPAKGEGGSVCRERGRLGALNVADFVRLHGGKALANRVEVVVRDLRVDGIVRARCVLDETRVRRAVLDFDLECRRDINAMCCHKAFSFRSWDVIPGRWYSIEGLASGPVREAGGRGRGLGGYPLALISLCRKCVSIASVTFDGQIMPACLCLRLGRGDVDHRHSEVVGFRIVVGVQEVVEEKMGAIGDAVTEDGGILVDELDVLLVVDGFPHHVHRAHSPALRAHHGHAARKNARDAGPRQSH